MGGRRNRNGQGFDAPGVEVVGMSLVVAPSPEVILALLPRLLSLFEAGDCLRLPIVNVK